MAIQIKLKNASGSNPSASDLVVGEVAIRTDNGKLFTKKDDGTVAEISGSGGGGGSGNNFSINTLSSSSGSGGGSASFNGTATRFTLSDPPAISAQQLLVSVNGVIQKPNSGTSPSEGFAIDGNDIIFASAPATNAGFFIITYDSLAVNTPSTASIVNAMVNNSAAIAGTKISPDFGSQNIVTTGSAGIGVTSLSKKFHVKGDDANGTQVLVQAASGTNSAGIQFDPASGDTFEYQAAASGLFVAYNRTDNRTDLFVDGAGNIGMQTSSPATRLHMTSSSDFGIRLTKTAASDAEIKNTNSLDLCCSSGGAGGQVVRLLTGANPNSLTARMGVYGTKILMGMTSTGITSPNNPRLQVQTMMGILANNTANSSTALVFQNPAGRQGFINTNASGITIVGTSDYRVKKDINYTIDAIPIIKQVKPCTFKFKADQDNLTVHGFIAHELQAVLPEAVTGEKDEVVTQAKIDSGEYEQETLGNEIHQGVDAGKLIPLLTKALQEAIVRIEALESK